MIYIALEKGFFMAPPVPANKAHRDLEVLKLLREYGDLYRYAVIANLRSMHPEESDNELNLVISRLVSNGRLICDKNKKLSIKPMGKPR